MRKGIIVVSLLAMLLLSFSTSTENLAQQQSSNPSYQIIVNSPKQVYIEQTFNISFELVTSVINSTNFQYVTPGIKVVDMNGEKAYEGTGGYFMLYKINLTNATELIVSFVGRVIGQLAGNPGVILYSYNFSSIKSDLEQQNNYLYYILLSWSGNLWLNKLKGWDQVISSLPTFYSGNYTVVFKEVNSSVCVYSIFINSTEYLIKYNTGIPWKCIGYVGIRLDTDTILPQTFTVKGNSYISCAIPFKYIVYINGKEYSYGNSSSGKITLKLFSPVTINITYPQLQLYKVISISPNGDIKMIFPIYEILLVILTIIIIGLGIIRETKRK